MVTLLANVCRFYKEEHEYGTVVRLSLYKNDEDAENDIPICSYFLDSAVGGMIFVNQLNEAIKGVKRFDRDARLFNQFGEFLEGLFENPETPDENT